MKLLFSLLGTAVLFACAFLFWFFLFRDSWEVDNLVRLSSELNRADQIQNTDPLQAYKIYDSVLKETSQHRVSIDTLASSLANAQKAKDKLRPLVDQQLEAEQKERQRQADEEKKAAEAERTRIAEEERRKQADKDAARKLEEEQEAAEAKRKEAALAYRNLPQSAREALNAIKRVEARVEIGVNYSDYSSIVGEAWAEAKLFIESPEGKKFPEYNALLAKAVDNYKLALDIWHDKIEYSTLYKNNADVDALQQMCWLQAGLWIELAESLLSGEDADNALENIQSAIKKQDDLREKWAALNKKILDR